MKYMNTTHLTREIQFSSGKLYGIRGELRLPVCSCYPLVKIYRHDSYVPILGRTKSDAKEYHIGIVFPEEPAFVPGIDEAAIESMTSFDLIAEVLLNNQEFRVFEFRNLYSEYESGEWELQTEDQSLLMKLLAIKPF